MTRQVGRNEGPPSAKVTSELDLRADEPRDKKPKVDFPFKLTVEHAALDLPNLFAVAEAFDFYEVRGVGGENVGKARRQLCVDIIEVTSTSTTLHVTPAHPMSYGEIATEMDHMVTGIAKLHLPGGKAKGMRVQWIVPNTGIPSDMRGRLAVVH